MYKWKMVIYMSGIHILHGIYIGEEENNTDVINKILNDHGKGVNTFTGVSGDDSKINLLFKISSSF